MKTLAGWLAINDFFNGAMLAMKYVNSGERDKLLISLHKMKTKDLNVLRRRTQWIYTKRSSSHIDHDCWRYNISTLESAKTVIELIDAELADRILLGRNK